VPAGHVGQPCSSTSGFGCIDGACVGPDGGVSAGSSGQCVAPLPNGSACETGAGCQSGVCDWVTRRCVAACP
jgi:hypothetical protein